jgi:energy-converting hydrogenase A subunit M
METQWREKCEATKACVDEISNRLKELHSKQQDIVRGTFHKILKVQVKEVQDVITPRNLYVQCFHNEQKFKTKTLSSEPFVWDDTFSL